MAAVVQLWKQQKEAAEKRLFRLLFANCQSMFLELVSKFSHSTTYYLLIFKLVAGRGWYYVRAVP